MSFPTTASFVPSRIEVPPPPLSSLLSSPFFFVFAFLLHSMPRQNFSTRDISRYEWGATGTIFPSSCYPVSFFAVARPRDLSFAAARFQSPLSLLSRPLTPLLVGFRATFRCSQRTVASLVQRSPSSISFRGWRLFRVYFRYEPRTAAARIFLRSGLSQFTGVSVIARADVSAPIWTKSRITPQRPRLSQILYRRAFQSDYRFDESTTCFACPHGVNH